MAKDLGPLTQLVGPWKNELILPGHGSSPGCCPGLIQWPDVSINLMEKVVE